MSIRLGLSMKMRRLTRDGTAEPVSRDNILRRERKQERFFFPCSADHVQDWEPYPVDPYSYYMFGGTLVVRFDIGSLWGFVQDAQDVMVLFDEWLAVLGLCSVRLLDDISAGRYLCRTIRLYVMTAWW